MQDTHIRAAAANCAEVVERSATHHAAVGSASCLVCYDGRGAAARRGIPRIARAPYHPTNTAARRASSGGLDSGSCRCS